MAVSILVMFTAVLYAFVLIQFTEGNIEELQSFLLSIQECMNRTEQSTAPENDKALEYLHDRDCTGAEAVEVIELELRFEDLLREDTPDFRFCILILLPS